MRIDIKRKDINIFSTLFIVFFLIISFTDIIIISNKDSSYEDMISKREIIFEENLESIIIDEIEKLNIKQDEIDIYTEILQDYKDKIIQKELELKSASRVNFVYQPNYIKNDKITKTHTSNITDFIDSRVFIGKNMFFDTVLSRDKIDTRGKMKNKKVRLFDIFSTPPKEVMSVFIHELGHYIDIYYLTKKVFFNPSDKFYEISWEDTRILKKDQDITDFVSGYAMTNKYEDFAESFTYYILHNEDFLKKANYSDKLMKKYDFFGEYVFVNNEFRGITFGINDEILDYYWDITKIEFFLEKLLYYVKNGI